MVKQHGSAPVDVETESPAVLLDRALRPVLNVPKETMLKEEAKLKAQKTQQKATKKSF